MSRKSSIILLFVITSLFLLFASSYSVRSLPKDVQVTNITDRSATISWTSSHPTKGVVLVSDDEFENLVLFNPNGHRQAYDDRDVNRLLILEEENAAKPIQVEEIQISKDHQGTYYTHHVTISDLSPDKQYYFMTGNGDVFYKSGSKQTNTNQFSTLIESEEKNISVPDPAYGRIFSELSENDDLEYYNPNDGIIYLQVRDDSLNESSSMISVPLNIDGTWYIDLNTAKASDNNAFLKDKDYSDSNIYHQVVVITEDQSPVSTTIPIYQDAPAFDIITNDLLALDDEMSRKVTLLSQAENLLKGSPISIHRFDNLVFKSHAICCEEIVCNDGTTFKKDDHTPHTTCEARAEEGCKNHEGVKSQSGACDVSSLKEETQFCIDYCGIDSNKDGKLPEYEANFDIKGQWCQCCQQECGGGFDCKTDPRWSNQCGGGESSNSSQPNSPGSSQTTPPSSSSSNKVPSERTPKTNTPTSSSQNPSEPPGKVNDHLPLMIAWQNWKPEFGPAYVYSRPQQLAGLLALDAPVTKMVMVISEAEVQQMLAQADSLKSGGVKIIGLNSEGWKTPASEMNSIRSSDPNVNSVAKSAKMVTDQGFEFLWGPIRANTDSVPDAALATMMKSGMTGLAIQEQKPLEDGSTTAQSRIAAVEKTRSKYLNVANSVGISNFGIHVQLMHERCPDLQKCVDFVAGMEAIPVDSIAIWSNGAIPNSFVNAIRGGNGLGGAGYSQQENSPYDIRNGMGSSGPLLTCEFEGMEYNHGTRYHIDGEPRKYCYGGDMQDLVSITEGQICPDEDFCSCKDSGRVISIYEPDRTCTTKKISVYSDNLSEGTCVAPNACRGKYPGYTKCTDVGDEELMLTCTSTCDESWNPCDSDRDEVPLNRDHRASNSAGDKEQLSLFQKLVNKVFAVDEEVETWDIALSPSEGLVTFPNPGNYCVDYKGEDYCFEITRKRNNLLYVDIDSDQVYNPKIDVNIAEDVSVLEVDIEQVELVYEFREGLNLISFNHIPYQKEVTAIGLLEQLNQAGQSNALSIARYDNGRWIIVGQRDGEIFSSEDFTIIPGVGYLVRANRDFEVRLEGGAIVEAVPVYLRQGWNLLGVNGVYRKQFTADKLIDSIDGRTSIDAENVTKWNRENSQFEGYQKSTDDEGEIQIYGFDYPILNYEGYFVKIKSGEDEWIPGE